MFIEATSKVVPNNEQREGLDIGQPDTQEAEIEWMIGSLRQNNNITKRECIYSGFELELQWLCCALKQLSYWFQGSKTPLTIFSNHKVIEGMETKDFADHSSTRVHRFSDVD